MKVLLIFLLSALLLQASGIAVHDLRTEHEVDPTGVSVTPRLSWQISSEERGQRQSGFHLLASSSLEKLAAGEGDLWNENRKESGQRLLVPWKGSALKEGQTVFWKILVRDVKGKTSEWSAPAKFTVAPRRKLNKAPRLSEFESSSATLNEIYQRNLAALGSRLDRYQSGEVAALGDGAVLSRSIRELLFHYDCAPHLLDWIKKVHAGQNDLGYFPGGPGQPFGPIISDASIIVPHAVWWMSGDLGIIKESWERMENYMIRREESDLLMKGTSWGAPIADHGGTPPEMVDLCYFGITSRLMTEMAYPSERQNDALRYLTYTSRIQQSFAAQYLGKDGLLTVPTQDAQVLAIRSSVMKPDPRKPVIAAFIKDAVPLRDLSVLAAKPLLPVLALTGNQDLAFDLVTDPANPWADEKKETFLGTGATEWLMTSILGIDAGVAGFQQIRLTPTIPSGDRLAWAKGSYQSPAGRIFSHWEKGENGTLFYRCTIPTGILAIITLPLSENQAITEGGKSIEEAFGVDFMRRASKPGTTELIAQSGTYHFTIR